MPRLPRNDDRTVLVGRTGTGKTVAGLWHLSNYSYEKPKGMPWVIIDFKRDKNINSIDNLQEIDFDYVPTDKDDGIFIIHALPADVKGSTKEASPVESYLTKLWEREHIGIFIDETYVIGDNTGLELCLTQGRSKLIPMILCTQRPVWVSRFAFSEASFIQCFALNDDRDLQTVEAFMPIDFGDEEKLGKHQSFYYDIAEDEIFRAAPVPAMPAIREIFAGKLHRKRVRI
jgi:hypothetical protein